jgi:hypothetical protein
MHSSAAIRALDCRSWRMSVAHHPTAESPAPDALAGLTSYGSKARLRRGMGEPCGLPAKPRPAARRWTENACTQTESTELEFGAGPCVGNPIPLAARSYDQHYASRARLWRRKPTLGPCRADLGSHLSGGGAGVDEPPRSARLAVNESADPWVAFALGLRDGLR